jgi:hypothetical protein
MAAAPWFEGGRRSRAGDGRPSQRRRSEARTIQRLLAAFQALQHRGCQTSKLGHALVEALRKEEDSAAGPSEESDTPDAPSPAEVPLPRWAVPHLAEPTDSAMEVQQPAPCAAVPSADGPLRAALPLLEEAKWAASCALTQASDGEGIQALQAALSTAKGLGVCEIIVEEAELQLEALLPAARWHSEAGSFGDEAGIVGQASSSSR